MNNTSTLDSKVLKNLPHQWPEDLLPAIGKEISGCKYKIIILDDDPTGTQTARDLPILTHWSVEELEAELTGQYPAFFILTNSRSLPRQDACTLAIEIGTNIRLASENTGVRVVIISRSDSTLRGHFPAEVDAMARTMTKEHLPYLIVPFFLEGGRFTMNDIHYVQEEDRLIPAAQTPFARDAAFGFNQSDLKLWVEEKTGGKIAAQQVNSITLDDIRKGGPDRIAELLAEAAQGKACIVNAVSYRDMEVLVAALLKVEGKGMEFLYRTAASFVRTRIGLDPVGGLLAKEEMVTETNNGGLFIIGSYVKKTTQQVARLFQQTSITPVEVQVQRLLEPSKQKGEISRVITTTEQLLEQGLDVAVFTSRELVTGPDDIASLAIGNTISSSLIEIVKGLQKRPRYLVAKGGITSSDVATKGLNVKRAMVIGQAQPGVPAWQLGEESRYPGMTYIVYPGNVGDTEALARLQKELGRESDADIH